MGGAWPLGWGKITAKEEQMEYSAGAAIAAGLVGAAEAPGVFVKNNPAMTIMEFLMLHLLYGLLVGVLYQAWA